MVRESVKIHKLQDEQSNELRCCYVEQNNNTKRNTFLYMIKGLNLSLFCFKLSFMYRQIMAHFWQGDNFQTREIIIKKSENITRVVSNNRMLFWIPCMRLASDTPALELYTSTVSHYSRQRDYESKSSAIPPSFLYLTLKYCMQRNGAKQTAFCKSDPFVQ